MNTSSTGPRRSTRIRNKKDDKPQMDPTTVSPSTSRSKPARKRQKISQQQSKVEPTQKKARRRRLTGNGPIEELPLEVLLEILKYLNFEALLDLSRTTKYLRSIVLDQNLCETIWKEGFESVQFPLEHVPKDSDWSLPRLAALTLDNTCDDCGVVSKYVTTYWMENMRLCNRCYSNHFVSPNYEDEVEAKITHVTEIRYYPPSGRARDMGCLRSMYEKHKAAMLPLRDNEKGLKKYIEEQREILSGYRRFISALRRWEDNYPGDKVAYADQKRRDQELIYMSYLEKLGFKDEAEMMGLSALETLPRFRSKNALTEKDWEKITPQVIEIMTEVRETLAKKSRDEAMALAKRKKEESIQMRLAHLNAVREYYVLRHRHEIVPNVVDLAIAEPFFSLITGTPYDEPVTSKEFIPLLDHIPRISQEWREAAMDLLLGLMAQPSGSGGTLNKGKEKDKRFSPDRSVLDRATTFFSCIWCTEILAYPTVLAHPCVSQKRRSTAKSDDRGAPSDSGDFFLNYWDVTIWNRGHDQLEYDHETSECAKHLVTLCGKDPASLTLEAMDQLDVRFECLRCHKPNFKEGRLVMNWRNALMHEFKKHSEQDTFKTGWLLLSDEDTVTAKAKEVIAARKNGLNVPPQYYCVECSFSHIEDGQIFYPPGRYPPPLKGPDSKCSRNHDMSHGVFEQHRYPRNVKVAGFVGDTLPVKI